METPLTRRWLTEEVKFILQFVVIAAGIIVFYFSQGDATSDDISAIKTDVALMQQSMISFESSIKNFKENDLKHIDDSLIEMKRDVQSIKEVLISVDLIKLQ